MKDELIEVVGHAPAPLKEADPLVVLIGGKYYYKHDATRVTRVNGRYYRIKSPLIVTTANGEYALKKECRLLSNGVYIHKNDKTVKDIDGNECLPGEVVKVGAHYYRASDKRITACAFSGVALLKSEAIRLSVKYYDGRYVSKKYVTKDSPEIVDTPDGYIQRSSAAPCLNGEGSPYYVHVESQWLSSSQIGIVPKELTSSGVKHLFETIRIGGVPKNSVATYGRVHPDHLSNFSEIEDFPVLVHNSKIKELKAVWDDYYEKQVRPEIIKVKKLMDESYSDAGPDENNPKRLSLSFKTFRGGGILHRPETTQPIISKAIDEVGFNYTFGVEIETSAGLLSNHTLESLGLTSMADGTIGSAEYVTQILHGNDGLAKLKEQCKVLSEETMVDDRCSIHVHIGGARGTDTPKFDKTFLKNAILLGCQIEDDLFGMCPKSRRPDYRHCHGIKRYAGINDKEFNLYIGRYLWGPLENSVPIKDDSPSEWEMYKAGTDGRYLFKSSLNRWCEGRYKWLNLINAATVSRLNTIEFRIFAGSTNFDKIKNYVRISGAITKFIENYPDRIAKGNVSLTDVITTILSGNTQKEVLTFINERTARFNKPKPKPKVKKSAIQEVAEDQSREVQAARTAHEAMTIAANAVFTNNTTGPAMPW